MKKVVVIIASSISIANASEATIIPEIRQTPTDGFEPPTRPLTAARSTD
jgi:hypothetical protein